MELTDISKEIYDATRRLDEGSRKIFKLAEVMAEKERDYRRALQIEIIKLKTEGMSVTLINDIARGETSDKKYERDKAEALYQSARDSMNALKTQINGLQSILKIQSEV